MLEFLDLKIPGKFNKNINFSTKFYPVSDNKHPSETTN